ncbi:MAG: glycoside hydrolase family 127 protein, partial [Verrucomicrobiales bacterium]
MNALHRFALLFAATTGLVSAAPQLKPPMHGLEEVGPQDVNLRGGFWGPRLAIHHKTTIPHVLDMLEERKHIANFNVAAKVLKGGGVKQGVRDLDQAGQALEGNGGNHGPGSNDPNAAKDGEIVGHSAFDSDVHKGLEGACYTLGHCKDPALHQRVESILDRIAAAQEKDGYLVSYFTGKEPQNKWGNLRHNHEMYNAGHFFEFAVAHHQLTGETKALDMAKRFADHIDSIFGPNKRYDVDGHQEVELALVKLYRATGEKRYLDLCRFFLEERGHLHGTERKPFTEVIPRGDPPRLPGETIQEWRRKKWGMRNGRMQDHKPVLQQTEAVGHAVRAGYMYSAMADLARFSDAPEYTAVLDQLWQDVVGRKLYLTGGLGTAQYGDEGFGDPYLLPNKTYCESCASIAHVFWQHRMNLLKGDARYADVLELVLYNSALSGMSLSGDSFFYQNPLESEKGGERSKWIGLACCPTNLARFTPQVGGFVYAHKGDRLFVNLFAAGEGTVTMDDGNPVKITQETNYPWDGRIQMAIAPEKPSEFDLCLRIPGWALGKPVPGDLYRFADSQTTVGTLKVNGEMVEAKPGQDGYVHLKRTWKAGDRVELDLPMPVSRVLAHEKVEENKGKVALMRGPVVYCFEGIDNQDIDVFKLSLPESAETTTEHDAKLLGGVTVIRAQGLDEKKNPVKLTAIPYFAWA